MAAPHSEGRSVLVDLLGERFAVDDVLSSAPAAHGARAGGDTASRPKVVHLCWMDGAGAGTSAYRLHKGLLGIGVDSTMLVLHKTRNDATVKVPPIAYGGHMVDAHQRSSAGSVAIATSDYRWRLLLSQYPNRPSGAELFSDPYSDVRLEFVREIACADIVNFHWMGAILDYPSLPRALAEKPVVWTQHDMNPFSGGCHYSDGCERYTQQCGQCPNLGSTAPDDASRHFHAVKTQALQNATLRVVTPSVWLGQCSQKSSLLRRFPHSVIPYGLPTDVFRPLGREALRASYGIGTDKKLVLFGAASITIERKGLRYLIDALKRLAETGDAKDVVLGVFGAVVHDTRIDVPFPIIQFGVVSDESYLAKIYSAADVYMMPTLADNLPNTVLEALSCGLPTVGFETGGVPDMIEHEKNGYLVKQRDVEGLVKGILWALAPRRSRDGIQQYCRQVAVDKYDESIQARAYLDIYTRMLAPKLEALSLVKAGEDAVNTGATQNAAELFARAASLFPLSQAHNGMGVLHYNNGNVTHAIDSFAQALRINPGNREALLNLGDIAVGIGQVEQFIPIAAAFLDTWLLDTEVRALLTRAQTRALDNLLENCTTARNGFVERPYAISAIVAVAHEARFVEETIDDLLAQDGDVPVEIVCVDTIGGMRDFSFLAARMKEHGCIRCYSPNDPLAIYQAVNLGLHCSTADYCFVAATGDRLAPDCLRLLAQALQENPSAAVAYGDTYLTDTPHQVPGRHAPSAFGSGSLRWRHLSHDEIIEQYGVGPHPMWRRSLHDHHGFFDFRYDTGADQDMWLRVAREHALIHVPAYTGLVWLDTHAKGRFTRTLRQFPHVRAKFKPFPLSPPGGADEIPSPPIGSDSEGGAVLDDIASLVERGRNREALELYEANAELFASSPHFFRVQQLIERLRQVVNGAVE